MNKDKQVVWRISIHALHEESDQAIREHVMADVDFNPRSP